MTEGPGLRPWLGALGWGLAGLALLAAAPVPQALHPQAWPTALGPIAGPTMPPEGPGVPTFRLPQPGWSYRFPQDHGAHPWARTEWWYLTGQGRSPEGQRVGYELTFFKTGLVPRAPGPTRSRWRSERLWLAHLALSDLDGQAFHHRERSARAGFGLAGASEAGLDVRLGGWRLGASAGGFEAEAHEGPLGLKLGLRPTRPPVVHGRQGLSWKGAEPGAVSHYVSWPQLAARGEVFLPGRGTLRLEGRAWLDHEWGSSLWPEGLAGWDWAGLHFQDGSALMVYLLRDAKGGLRPQSAGTWIPAQGPPRPLQAAEIQWQATGQWISPHSQASYPSGWRLSLPSLGLTLRLTPRLLDQELRTEASTRVTYWEGAVAVEGQRQGQALAGEGYVELTGYAGRGGPGT